MAVKFCKDCGDYRPASDSTRNARSRDGLAFYCRIHLAERSLRSREARRTKPRVRRLPPEGSVVPDGHKWCGDCGRARPLDEFVRTVASSSGYGSYCKPCHNSRSRSSRDRLGGSRTYHLSRRYGITAAEADHMWRRQDGLCAICRASAAVHVDHDHETGAVRALLCFNCNGGLGQFKDDPLLLHLAAAYVEGHRSQQLLERLARTYVINPDAHSPDDHPPVGSDGRPERPRGDRATGRTSGSRRRRPAGEADT